ncbi:unnamed protein product [Calicophoron daubneyi]|uniref:Uncharacterized protein n=1 Tax=Calicophoron daubneyi TaxID=300641 RepID=A0AAV2TE14_CALDB
MLLVEDTSKRYRRLTPSPEFLHSPRRQATIGRPTRAYQLRTAHQLINAGRCTDEITDLESVGESCVPQDYPIKIIPSDIRRKSVYPNIRNRLIEQLKISPQKLHSFLLGSQIFNATDNTDSMRQLVFADLEMTPGYGIYEHSWDAPLLLRERLTGSNGFA